MVNDRQNLDLTTFAGPAGGAAVEWRISDAPVPYLEAVAAMDARVAAIAAHPTPELVWLLQHPPLYTSGTSGKDADLLDPRFPLFATGRGGQLTYHGTGQLVARSQPFRGDRALRRG
jgi:lipoyl(octanoyl) transferase